MAISTAIDQSAVARVVGIKTIFRDLRGGILFLPQRVAVVGQGATASVYDTTKRQVTSAQEVAELYGFGSPVHLASRELFPVNGDGVGTIPVTIYPLEDDGSATAAAGDITPVGAGTKLGTYTVSIGGIESEAFNVEVGDAVADLTAKITAAINAVLEMPFIAADATTEVTLTSKWKGASANGITVSVDGPTDTGVTYTITQPVGGTINPDVDDALNQVGGVWETMVLNCLEIADTTSLDKYSTFGEGRWGALVRKPLVVFTGNTEADRDTAITISDGRKTDRTNVQLVAPGSVNIPLVVAARQLSRIVVRANNNPPFDYGSLPATGLLPGADGDQWTYIDRDVAVKAGSSTSEVRDGVVTISDVVTFYHPTGEQIPGYRYVVDIVKLQNIIFNIDLIFANPEWDGAPLIPDDQPTSNRAAKKPKTAKAAVAFVLDDLGLEAIISDPETAKENVQAQINDQNPKRLDMVIPVQLSGNTNIISIDLEFGFFFGPGVVVA